MSKSTSSEEEFALVTIYPGSFIAAWAFTKNLKNQFKKFVLMEDLNETEYRHWQSAYRRVIKLITYLDPGKQLILKSTYNTGRREHILRLFPGTRFVYLHRDKDEVIRSTIHMHRTFSDFAIAKCEDDELVANVISCYSELEVAYIRDRCLIPEGRLVKIRYEDFVDNPVTSLKAIYRDLSLDGFESARPRFQRYVDSQRDYRVNEYKPEVPVHPGRLSNRLQEDS